MKRLAVLGLLSLLVVLGTVPALGGAPAPRHASPPPPRTTTSKYAYHWPIKPFDRQHRIRGTFGDPRTMAVHQSFGVTGPAQSGSYSFHNGVDIVAKPGTPVYPVVGGVVVRAAPHEIVVLSSRKRVFQYWHLRRHVEIGQKVAVAHTVLGWTQRPFDHVHLTELDDGRAQNPLARGHLEPYRDDTKPRVVALDVSNGGSPHLTQGGWVSREDELAIKAIDLPALPLRGAFAGLPQTPALVEWRRRVRRRHHAWGQWHVAANFRRTVPNDSLWGIYAAGTYQNSPVFDHRLFKWAPGRYLFRVDLDPSRLAPGRYELQARVFDIRGNSSTKTWRLRIGRT